jgi:hypothetical protein
MEHEIKRNRSIRKSYSIPEEIVNLLEKEAYAHDTNSSSLLVKSLKKYLNFELPLSSLEPVTMTEMCFYAMLERLGPDDLLQVASEQATRNFGVILSLLHGKPDINSLIERYFQVFGKYSGWYSFSYEKLPKNNSFRLAFQHKRGIKWSRFLAEYNHIIMEKLCYGIECNTDNNVVTFDIVPKQQVMINH